MTAKTDRNPLYWGSGIAQPTEMLDSDRVAKANSRPTFFDWTVLEVFPDANAITFQNRGFLVAPTYDLFDVAITAPTPTPYARTSTAGTSGSSSGIRPTNYGGNGESVRPEWFPVYVHRFQIGASITSLRQWQGLTSASLDAVATPTTQHVAAFRFDTGVDGTNFWRCITCDGASNVTSTTTSVAIATNTNYLLRIEFTSASEITFWINDALVATHTTNLPGSTTLISPISRVVTLTTQARRGGFARMAVAY